MIKTGKKRKVGKKGNIFKKRLTPGITIGTRLEIADNSGIKICKVIGFLHKKGRLRRRLSGSVGDVAVCSVVKGPPEHKGKVYLVIIVRQKQPFRRADGTRICFESNAGVVVNKELEPFKASQIKGPISKEAAEIAPRVASIASMVY